MEYAVGTAYGWRGWSIKKFLAPELHGVRGRIYEPNVAATCLSGYSHRSPHSTCKCGWWSYKTLTGILLWESMRFHSTGWSVLGFVEVSGRNVEHEHVWRSEFIELKKLFILPSQRHRRIRNFLLDLQLPDVEIVTDVDDPMNLKQMFTYGCPNVYDSKSDQLSIIPASEALVQSNDEDAIILPPSATPKLQ